MSPKAKHELAREHLERAQRDFAQEDAVGAVMFLHLAAEAAIVSLADAEGIDTERRHDKKAEAAKALNDRGILDEDLTEVLRLLNQVRKDATYEGEDPDLGDESVEDLVVRIESAVATAEASAS